MVPVSLLVSQLPQAVFEALDVAALLQADERKVDSPARPLVVTQHRRVGQQSLEVFQTARLGSQRRNDPVG